jgi:hypothetical protein
MRFGQFYVYSGMHSEDPLRWRRSVIPFEVGLELELIHQRVDAPFRKMSLFCDPWIVPFYQTIGSVMDVRVRGDVTDVAALPVAEARSRWGELTIEAIDLIAAEIPWPQHALVRDMVLRVSGHAGPYIVVPFRTKDRARGQVHTTRIEIDEAGIRIALVTESGSSGVETVRPVADFDMPDRPYLRFPAHKSIIVDDRLEYRTTEGDVVTSVVL